MTHSEMVAVAAVVLPLLTAAAVLVVPRSLANRAALAGAAATAAVGLGAASLGIARSSRPTAGTWIVLDARGSLLLAVASVVSLASVLASPRFLATAQRSVLGERDPRRFYYTTLFVFWALLMAVPLAGNLAAAWLLVEASTAVSALLVGFSGRSHAIEAGWKYLILTSLGLGVALLGIVTILAGAGHPGIGALSWANLSRISMGVPAARTGYLLVLAGLAAKIGWAPVHNWLPDAHSEAPPPVSAMLSAVLLPAVLLIAWRTESGMAPVIGTGGAQRAILLFGLVSLAVAVPFLWRPMPVKRLLAYSSLEHLGIIALGVGFGTPLALAGVALHIVSHAVSKSLGFFSASSLIELDPRASQHFVGGVGRADRVLGCSLGLSLGALSGLPPSPLFVSEVLILAAGFESGRQWAAGLACVLLALGFLGVAHATIETVVGRRRVRRIAAPRSGSGGRLLPAFVLSAAVLLVTFTATSPWLPSSSFVAGLARTVG